MTGVSLGYRDLVKHFGVDTVTARIQRFDILFIRDIHRQRIRSSFLLDVFPVSVPVRLLRHQSMFASSLARPRVNTVKTSIFNRAPSNCNAFLDANRDVDIWRSSAGEFRSRVAAYVARDG